MIRKTVMLCVALFTLCFGLINAQIQNDSIDSDQLIVNSLIYSNIDSNPVILKDNLRTKKISTGLEVGTSFFYSPKNYYGPSYYIAPSLHYRITPRFNLQAGFICERSTFYPLQERDQNIINGLAVIKTNLYAQGSYLLFPRLTIQGTVFQTINDAQKYLKYPYPVSYNSKGALIGLDYKIGNSLSIGFNVRVQNNSYYPINSSYYNSVWDY
jgi:hypothetical protein